MNVLTTILAARILIILGIINFITGALIFFTCRCLPGSKLGSNLMKHRKYQRFFKYHCYLWWVFWPSVMLHAVVAIIFFGWSG